MSSMMRENSRSRRDYPNFSGIVRRMVNLPRSILGGFSRAMGHGVDLMGRNDRRNQILFPPNPHPILPPTHFPMLPPQVDPNNAMMIDEWTFLNNFEQNYGVMHPFFYACRLIQGLKIAQDEKKLVFLYLHSPDHPFTAEFCRETLCSEIVVQYIDANFVSWGGICDRGEGLEMSRSLRPASFPFCAVIVPASADNISVLQQIEGPVSPAELVEILQRTLEEQGVGFGSSRAKEEEDRRADCQLIEDQNAAYLASLKLDQEKEMERHRNSAKEETVQKASSASGSGFSHSPTNNPILTKPSQVTETYSNKREKNQHNGSSSRAKDNQVTQILIRFPNGERKEHSFSTADKIQAIYKYIDSLNLPGIGSYRLISSFPRKVYGADLMGITLKDAGFHPRATLFLDLS
ncbi:plant UBX domain-containing protein 10-like [Silene latifolia]|uniref:plant UBX domain-containing protein 10-like n=1 Tax=Silene latifolia TaxID=37657 RepID=UPI003D780E91